MWLGVGRREHALNVRRERQRCVAASERAALVRAAGVGERRGAVELAEQHVQIDVRAIVAIEHAHAARPLGVEHPAEEAQAEHERVERAFAGDPEGLVTKEVQEHGAPSLTVTVIDGRADRDPARDPLSVGADEEHRLVGDPGRLHRSTVAGPGQGLRARGWSRSRRARTRGR